MIEHEYQEDEGIEVEQVGDGVLYLKGHPYPHKGIPTIAGVERANLLKRNLLKPWIQYSCTLPEYPTPFAKEFQKLSPTLAYIFEYDQAYRFRLQDLLAETTKEKLLKQPIKELTILLRIHKQRDYPELHKKFKQYFTLLTILLLIPPFRGIILKRIETLTYSNLLPDESDLYWMKQKQDYDYRGHNRI